MLFVVLCMSICFSMYVSFVFDRVCVFLSAQRNFVCVSVQFVCLCVLLFLYV